MSIRKPRPLGHRKKGEAPVERPCNVAVEGVKVQRYTALGEPDGEPIVTSNPIWCFVDLLHRASKARREALEEAVTIVREHAELYNSVAARRAASELETKIPKGVVSPALTALDWPEIKGLADLCDAAINREPLKSIGFAFYCEAGFECEPWFAIPSNAAGKPESVCPACGGKGIPL